MMQKPRIGLLFRVILHGVVLLGVSSIGFLAATRLVAGKNVHHDVASFESWFAHSACETYVRSSGSAAALNDFPLPIAIFDRNHHELAHSRVMDRVRGARGDATHLKPPHPRGRAPVEIACPGGHDLRVVVGGPPPMFPFERMPWLVFGVFVFVALGSVPLARSLLRPLRELLQSVEQFGGGDWSARASTNATDEIGDLARGFNKMAESIQSRIWAEKELLANISHELRTPLARARVVLDTARESTEHAPHLLDEIARDLGDLERLTDDVLSTIRLDFSQAAPANGLTIRRETVQVESVLQRAAARCLDAHPGFDLELSVEGELSPIQADSLLLLRLFENLIDNARKYSSATVHVRMRSTPNEILVEIEDHGIGVDPADLQRIFEPFFRSDRSRQRATGGTGLGLALSRKIAEAHGGSLTLRSEPGVGTTATVALPYAQRA